MKEIRLSDIVEVELKELATTIEPYVTKFVVSLNWDRTVREVSEEYLEENKAILIHFETTPPSLIESIPKFEPHVSYPNGYRVLAKSQYIGNVEGVELGGSFIRVMEVINVFLKTIGTDFDDPQPFHYEIIKVIR